MLALLLFTFIQQGVLNIKTILEAAHESVLWSGSTRLVGGSGASALVMQRHAFMCRIRSAVITIDNHYSTIGM
jgi:hypothetical protein